MPSSAGHRTTATVDRRGLPQDLPRGLGGPARRAGLRHAGSPPRTRRPPPVPSRSSTTTSRTSPRTRPPRPTRSSGSWAAWRRCGRPAAPGTPAGLWTARCCAPTCATAPGSPTARTEAQAKEAFLYRPPAPELRHDRRSRPARRPVQDRRQGGHVDHQRPGRHTRRQDQRRSARRCPGRIRARRGLLRLGARQGGQAGRHRARAVRLGQPGQVRLPVPASVADEREQRGRRHRYEGRPRLPGVRLGGDRRRAAAAPALRGPQGGRRFPQRPHQRLPPGRTRLRVRGARAVPGARDACASN